MLDELNNNINPSLLGSLGSNNINNVAAVNSNPYTKGTDSANELIDKGEISEEALKKYEAEAEIAKYKSLVLDMLAQETQSEEVNNLADLIGQNEYEVDNKTLADAIFNDEDAQNLLF